MSDLKEIIETVRNGQKIDPDDLKEITPAQCFVDNTAMVTAFFPELRTDNSDREISVKIPYIITSERMKIWLDANTLLKHGYTTTRFPNHENRWSSKSIREFLQSKNPEIDIEDMFQKIRGVYEKYIDLGTEPWIDVLSCWVIGTYFHRMFNSFPYIHLNGNMESGKTKTSSITMQFAFNGEIGVNSTASYLIRITNDNNASCAIDEAEKLDRSEDSQVLMAMYNAGYKKGAKVGKSEMVAKNWVPRRFDCYSPKIFSGIKRLYPTLASRTIPITMVRTNNKELKNRDINDNNPIFQEVRDELYLTVMTKHKEVSSAYENIEDVELTGREWELWRPILTIAKIVSTETYEKIRKLAIETQNQKRDTFSQENLTPKMLEALLLMTKENAEPTFYTLKEVTEFMTDFSNPYLEDFKWLNTMKNPSRWMGDELRRAGVVKGHSQQKKSKDGTNQRGFLMDRDLIQKLTESYRGI